MKDGMKGIDVCEMWPELFGDLDDLRRATVRQVFSSEYLTGCEPDRAAVADLVDLAGGHIDFDGYTQRSAKRMDSAPPLTLGG